jgi:hypothetical protein
MTRKMPWTVIGLGSAIVAVVALAVLLEARRQPVWTEAVTTVGDLHAVHAPVRVGEREVRGRARISNGDLVKTGDEGAPGCASTTERASWSTRRPHSSSGEQA